MTDEDITIMSARLDEIISFGDGIARDLIPVGTDDRRNQRRLAAGIADLAKMVRKIISDANDANKATSIR
jgi:hypothetical protein